VEKTNANDVISDHPEKHLHGRGEDPGFAVSNTAWQKHLHGRGEDRLPVNFNNAIVETPPRAWRRLPFSV